MKLTELQERWLQALESSDYKQTGGVLYDPDTNAYCCLGVATHLLDPDHWSLEGNTYLASDVKRAYGFYDNEARVKGAKKTVGGYTLTLTHCNDKMKMSFKEIAAFVRANPQKIFKPQEEKK